MSKEYINYLGLMMAVSIIFQMFAQGLTYSFTDLLFFRKRSRLLLRSLLAVLVLVPLASLLIIYLFHPAMHITVGLAILASCPAAPLHLVRIRKAGGKREYLISLHLILAILSLVTIPFTLGLMARAFNFHAEMNILHIIRIVGLLVIVPVSLGILMRSQLPKVSSKIHKSFTIIGNGVFFLGILYLIVVMFQLMFRRLLDMDLQSYIAMVLMVSVALTIGHFMAPDNQEEQMTLALESAARHPGFALLITSVNYSFDKASAILIPYFAVFIIISGLYIQWQKRSRTNK